MQNGKKLFATLAGIFLLVAGGIALIVYIAQLIMYRGGFSFYAFLNIQIDILYCLAGVFLLIRKPLLSAIMISAAALFTLIVCLDAFRYYASVHNGTGIMVQIAAIFSLILFAVGLYGKQFLALIMCIAAACFRSILLVINMVNLGHGNLLTWFGFLSNLLLVAAMVMAGFYLFSVRKTNAAQ